MLAKRCNSSAYSRLTIAEKARRDAHRMAGEIELKSPQTGAAKAEAYFERALAAISGNGAGPRGNGRCPSGKS
jgi:hypothetical protein